MWLTLLILAGIVNFGASIWLLVVAFQRSVWWGLAVLVIPLASLVFVLMYWQDAKKPFLVSVVSTLVLFGAITMYTKETDMDPERMAAVMEGIESGEIQPNEAYEAYGKLEEQTGEPPAEAVAGTPEAATAAQTGEQTGEGSAPSTDGASAEAVAVAGSAGDEAAQPAATEEKSRYPSPGNIKPDPLVVKKKQAESPSVRIKLENIASYKGRYFIITTNDGTQHRGLLSKVNDTTLFLSRKLYGGDFEYHIARKKVKYVDMLKEEYVKEFMEK